MNSIKVKFPARISMNLFTYPKKIVRGGYGIAIEMSNYLSINKSNQDNIKIISKENNVDLLVKYYLDEFRKISNIDAKVNIILELDNRFKNHVGFAFNSNIACALYFSLNELLEIKFTKEELLRYLFESYAELDDHKITKNDSTCMISQYCAFDGGMNVIDDLKSIYNYKFPNNYKLVLIHFDNETNNNNIEEIKRQKEKFVPMNINVIRTFLNNEIIPKLNNNNLDGLRKRNIDILNGSTRILRCKNYIESKRIIDTMNKLSRYGIVGLTSSSPTIYFISDNIETLNFNNIDYYHIDNNGITIM